MSDGHFPEGTPEPTTAMPVTPGPAGGPPPPAPPPGAPPLDDDNAADGSSQPPWVIPAVVGIVAVAVVLLALILTRGDDDNDDALPAVDTSTTTLAPDTTLPIVTETSVGETTTTTTETTTTLAPETTLEATTTVAPTTLAPTTLAPTTLAPTGPAAQPSSALGANTASLATVDGEQTFAVLGTCSSTPTVGLQAISSVLANESGTVYVVDVYLDEGGEPFVEVADMSQSIAGFIYGQDTLGTNFRWSVDVADPNTIDRATLEPLDGSSDPISLSMNADAPTECGRGFVAAPSPFPEAGPIDIVEQFEPDVPGDGFAVLAACDDGATYVTSGGGLIDIFFATGSDQFSSSYFVDLPDGSTFWSTPDGVTADQQIVVQNGGGGDTDYATQVVNFDDDQIGYLSVRIQPSVQGGVNLIDCPA